MGDFVKHSFYHREWIAQYVRKFSDPPRELDEYGFPLIEYGEVPAYCLSITPHGGYMVATGAYTFDVLTALEKTDGLVCPQCFHSLRMKGFART